MNNLSETDQNDQVASTGGVNSIPCRGESGPHVTGASGATRQGGGQAQSEESSPSAVRRIARLKKFVAKLKDPDTDPSSAKLSLHLSRQVSSGTTELLVKWPKASASELHTALVADLNLFVATASPEEWFAKLNLKPKTIQLLGQSPIGTDREELLLMILCDTYPDEIVKMSQGSAHTTQRVGQKGSGLFRISEVNGIFAKTKINGKTKTKAMETDDPATARINRSEWVTGLLKKERLGGGGKNTLASFLSGFFESRQALVSLGKISQGTVNGQKVHFGHLAAHWPRFNTIDVGSVDKDVIKDLENTLLVKARDRRFKNPAVARKLSKDTYNTFMALINQLVNYLLVEKKVTAEQYLDITNAIVWATRSSRTVQIPTTEEFTQMRAYLYKIRTAQSNGECGVKFDFFMLGGVRRRTANAAQVKHFSFARGMMKLTKLKHRAGQPDEKEVPILPELALILEKWIRVRGLGPEDFLFKKKNMNGALKAAAKHAGLLNWYHHACRKWFATMGLEQTGDPLAMAELLCHNDNGRTLLAAYRQACAAHLRPKVRGLKFLPGATPDSTIEASGAKAQRAVTKFCNLERSRSALILDHLLWIEVQIDEGREDALLCLPGLQVPVPAMYVPASARITIEANFQLLKKNLRYLAEKKDVICSDIAIATGIKQSILEDAWKTGRLQAVTVPRLCGYFNVNPMELLSVDLACLETPAPGTQSEAMVLEAVVSEPGTARLADEVGALKPAALPQKSADDFVIEQDQVTLAQTSSRNLRSLLFERDLTPPQLASKSGLSHAIVCQYIHGAAIPTDYSLPKLATALGVLGADIFDPNRASIVLDLGKIRANVLAIVQHSEYSTITYANKLNIGSRCLKRILKTGDISPSQANKMAKCENVPLKELLMDDVTARFPHAVAIDKVAVARNVNSLFVEQGIVRRHFSKQYDIDDHTLVRYLSGESKRFCSKVLSRLAAALHVSVKELIDPMRLEIKPTKCFAVNLRHLCKRAGVKRSTICRGFAVGPAAMDDLCNGSVAPTPSQVAGLCRLFGLSPRELLMQDVTSSCFIHHAEKGACSPYESVHDK